LGGSTQGQRQIFAQWQQGFKGFMGLHGVRPSSIMAHFEGSTFTHSSSGVWLSNEALQ
jgi:hypothetical protein